MKKSFWLVVIICLLITGCVFDFSSEAPVVGGLSLIDFTDRSGEEYCEKMVKLCSSAPTVGWFGISGQ